MKHSLLLFLTFFLGLGSSFAQDSVRIYGRVTDFDSKPIDSVSIRLKDNSFKNVYEVFSDADGYFSFKVLKGNYYCLYAIRLRDYSKTRLEYWAWNIPAFKDLEINPKYDRMELYGINAFEPQVSPFETYMIYFRPMCLTKALAAQKGKTTREYEALAQVKKDTMDIAPDSVTRSELQVKINQVPAEVVSITKILEYGRKAWMYGYLIQVKKPKGSAMADSQYDQITLFLKSNETGEMGMGECFVKKTIR